MADPAAMARYLLLFLLIDVITAAIGIVDIPTLKRLSRKAYDSFIKTPPLKDKELHSVLSIVIGSNYLTFIQGLNRVYYRDREIEPFIVAKSLNLDDYRLEIRSIIEKFAPEVINAIKHQREFAGGSV